MKTKYLILIIISIISNHFFAQGGNEIYRNKNNSYSYNFENKVNIKPAANTYINDSILYVSTQILMNVKADKFIVTLGLNQENKSSITCLEDINTKIYNLKLKLKKLGINDSDISEDFVSQTKVYDINFIKDSIVEYEKGFEIKKNIIISTNNLENIDLIIKNAAEYKIYDIIKIDYLNEDIEAIHDKIFEEAIKINQAKKEKYLRVFNRKEEGQLRMSEQFYYVFPDTQYNEYKAFETKEYETNYVNYNHRIVKKERKNTTYYYKGIDYRGFDKVINMAQTEVGVQYILTLNTNVRLENNNNNK